MNKRRIHTAVIGILVLILLIGGKAEASHFMGGQITYKCLGVDSTDPSNRLYEISLQMYRDCEGCDPTTQPCAGFGFPDQNNIYWEDVEAIDSLGNVYNIPLQRRDTETTDITLKCRPNKPSKCDDHSQPYGVQEWTFRSVTGIPIANGPIIVSHWDRMRNGVITTIDNPAGTMWYLWTTIDPGMCNNSPEFLNYPISLICKDEEFTYNQNAFDIDGDSLHFSLIPCRKQVDSTVDYNSPYDGLNPLSTVNGVNIDANNGALIYIPDSIEVAIMAVLVEEYRNGVKISETMRDLQVSVKECTNFAPKVSPIGNGGDMDTSIFAGNNFCLTFRATDANFNDTSKNLITLNISSGILPPATWSNPAPKHTLVSGDFCWKPSCDDIRLQPYIVTVLAQDNACPIPGSNISTFEIYVKRPVPSKPFLNCASVENTNSEVKLTWTYPVALDQTDRYLIYRAEGSPTNFTLIDSVLNRQLRTWNDTDTSLELEDSIYFYYMRGASFCGDTTDNSDTINTILLNSVYTFKDSLDFDWIRPYPEYDSVFHVLRNRRSAFAYYDSTSLLIYHDSITTCTPKYPEHIVRSYDTSGCYSNSNIVWDTIPGQTLPDSPVVCKVTVNLDNSVSIHYTGDTMRNDTFNLHRGSGNNWPIIQQETDLSLTTLTDNGANANVSAKRYRMSAVDSCDFYSELSIPFHKTINLEATAGHLHNRLKWNHYAGWDSLPVKYVLFRDDSIATDSLTELTDTFFVDSNLPCNETFVYRILAIGAGGGFCDSSYSDTSSATPYDSIIPDAPQFCVLTVADNLNDVIISYFPSNAPDQDSSVIWNYSLPVPAFVAGIHGDTSGMITDTILNVLPQGTGSGCFALDVGDTCGNTSSRNGPHCTIHVSAQGESMQNRVWWTPFTVWTPEHYVIYRWSNGSLDSIGIATDTNFIDANLPSVCDSTYTYRIKALNSTQPCPESWSDTARATPFDDIAPTFPELCNLSISQDGQDVEIEVGLDFTGDQIRFSLYREGNATPIAIFDSTSANSFVDDGAVPYPVATVCYYMTAEDSCGNISAASPAYCTMDLAAYPAVKSNLLEWQPFTLWTPDEYNVYGGLAEPLQLLGSTSDTTFTHGKIKCEESYIYRIDAIRNSDSCVSSLSDTVHAICSDIHFPNVFTPDGDGWNDFYHPVISQNITSMEVIFYNRWGEVIYETNDPRVMWDGIAKNGKPASDGVYFYIADVGLKHGKDNMLINFRGWVKLMRKVNP